MVTRGDPDEKELELSARFVQYEISVDLYYTYIIRLSTWSCSQ